VLLFTEQRGDIMFRKFYPASKTRVKLTSQQKKLKAKYLRIRKSTFGKVIQFDAYFIVDTQYFLLANGCDGKEEASWFCDMFAIALSKVMDYGI